MVSFQDYHIPMIRSGSKTETRREWKRPAVQEGEVYRATSPSMTPDGVPAIFCSHEDCDCYIRVQKRFKQRLGSVTDEEARREGDYENVAEFREGYERVYGDGAWEANKVVWAVRFEYVGRERPEVN